jgi:hypothetical protein
VIVQWIELVFHPLKLAPDRALCLAALVPDNPTGLCSSPACTVVALDRATN